MTEESLFDQALQKSAAERAAFLDEACAGDEVLRRRVLALLEAHEHPGSFLQQPLIDIGATQAPQPGPAPPIEAPGSRLGPYKLLQQIGEGGMGTVWMAEQTEPVQRKVALKVIKPGMDSAQVLARFEAERQALALMDHPNIAKVLDAGETGEPSRVGDRAPAHDDTRRLTPLGSPQPYFVMELVKGVPLTKYCDERRLTPRERLELFVPVCQAVQHAHQKGIIHRDLKPSNVLVALYDGTPVPKVIDFGVAKATGPRLTKRTLFTEFGAIVGTLEYMSPEQAELNNLDIDTRSDIYALGVLLYELLIGTTPLDRKRLQEASILEVLRLIREEDPPAPSTRLGTTEELPSIAASRGTEPKKLSGLMRGELDWIVMKCLDKDRNRRYETANGLAQDIERYLRDEPVLAGPPTARYRLRKFLRRHRAGVLTAAALVGLLAVGTVVSTLLAVRAVRAEGLAGERLSDLEKANTTTLKALEDTKAAQSDTQHALKQTEAAHQRTREALDAMTDDVIEQLLSQQVRLTEREREFLRKVLRYYEEYARSAGNTDRARHDQANGLQHVGIIRNHLGEQKEAEVAFHEALEVWQQLLKVQPAPRSYHRGLAQTSFNLGKLLKDTGRPEQAEKYLRRALSVFEQLAAAYPAVPAYRHDLAAAHQALSRLLQETARPQEAARACQDSLVLRRRLVAELPDDPIYRRALADGLNELGTILYNTGQFKEAETAHKDALGMYQQLVADFPIVPMYQRFLAITCHNLGLVFANTRRNKEAEDAWLKALAFQQKLAADFPAVPLYRHDLARSYSGLGVLYAQMKRPEESEKLHRAALPLCRKLVADAPEVPEYLEELGNTLLNVANRRIHAEDHAAGKTLLEEAMPHHQAALKANPRHPVYRLTYRTNRWYLCFALIGLKDHAGAVAAVEEMVRFGHTPAVDAYDAARIASRCIVLAQQDETLLPDKRDDAARTYADLAMARLTQAVALGHKDVAVLKSGPLFAPLRDRPDFQRLVKELETKPPAENAKP